eukprot:9493512-Pyramimonas_sp.AAC.1
MLTFFLLLIFFVTRLRGVGLVTVAPPQHPQEFGKEAEVAVLRLAIVPRRVLRYHCCRRRQSED